MVVVLEHEASVTSTARKYVNLLIADVFLHTFRVMLQRYSFGQGYKQSHRAVVIPKYTLHGDFKCVHLKDIQYRIPKAE